MRKFTLAALALFVSVCALPRAGNAAQMALKIVRTAADDGSNYFVAPQASSLDTDIGSTLTVEAWVNPDATDAPCSGSYQIVNKESTYEIALRDDADGNHGRLMTAIWPKDTDLGAWNWVDSTVEVPVNKWTHVAVTWDGLIVRLFVNGKFAASSTDWTGPGGAKGILNVAPNQGDPPNSPEPLRIGRRHNTAGCHQSFSGLIDEVRISKVVRYTEKGFDVPTQAFTPDADTVALYHFNDSSTAAADLQPLKDKLKAQGVKEDGGQGTQTDTDPLLDVQGASKDASGFHNDGALIGQAVLVPVTDAPFKDAATP